MQIEFGKQKNKRKVGIGLISNSLLRKQEKNLRLQLIVVLIFPL